MLAIAFFAYATYTLQVACESATKTNMVMIFGEITTTAKVDYEMVIRDTVRNIGFTSDDVGIDADKMEVLVRIEEQSPDIGQGVHGLGTKTLEETGRRLGHLCHTSTLPSLACRLPCIRTCNIFCQAIHLHPMLHKSCCPCHP